MSGEYTKLQVPGLPGVFFREMELELAGHRLSILAASAVDVLSAGHARRTAGAETPYWPVAWPAGLALARHLAGLNLGGMRVLEVGAGVGVSGLGAAIGGAEALVTDNQVPAMRLALMNARRNRIPLRAAAADWRAWPLRSRFDLVVGSDVTYEPAAFPALLAVLDAALTPGGEVLLTDPGRIMTSAFQKSAGEAGWSWQTTPLPREGNQAVFLYRLAR